MVEDYIKHEESERRNILINNILSSELLDDSKRYIANHKISTILQFCGFHSYDGQLILSFVYENIPADAVLKKREGVLFLLNYLFGLPISINQISGALESPNVLLSCYSKLFEPYLIQFLPIIFINHADRSANIRDQSAILLSKLSSTLSPHAFRLVYPYILSGMSEEDWRVKVGTLSFLKSYAPRISLQLSPLLPELIPAISECIYDSKRQVQLAGIETMNETCKVITNDDIKPIVPSLVSVIANPDESAKTLDMLLETTFVQNVDASVLALLSPLLGKALRGRSSLLKRKASKVIDIMCRLVQNPAHVKPFEPLLLPALNKVIDEIVDQEVCDVAKCAREILLKALGESKSIAASKFNSTQSLNNLQGLGSHSGSQYKSMNNLQEKLEKATLKDSPLMDDSSVGDVYTTGSITPTQQPPQPNGTQEELSGATAIAGPTIDVTALFESTAVQPQIYNAILQIIQVPSSNETDAKFNQICLEYISHICTYLSLYCTSINPSLPLNELNLAVNADDWRYTVAMTEWSEWKNCIYPFLSSLYPLHMELKEYEKTEADETSEHNNNNNHNNEELKYHKFYIHIIEQLRIHVLNGIPDTQHEEETDDTSLCNIEFSLAFGGKILLQNTFLKLGKGKRYGIVAKNGSGKTTLLTNIGLGTIEGLPPHLKTIYVQHDDITDDQGVSLIDELMASKIISEMNVKRETALDTLKGIFFTDEMINSPRSSLSGGWKMKLMIVRAMLSGANVLLLDEPTNHLDTASVAWLTKYLQNAHDVTCLIVTHDTQFLDDVCTDIIHYENKKLVYYHGNLTHFVKIHPEAKYYYELSTSTLSFTFPTPERLEGINSATKSIMKVENCTYTYPGKTVPQLKNVTVRVCLGSRIAVLGANGAGKSTLIKLLVQETEPDAGSGEVWKHRNLRVAYVAQHSFHHIEKHLEISPVDYIKWRFHGGVDKESLERPTMKLDEEEIEKKAVKRFGDVDQVLGRRKNGRTMEYECSFHGQTPRDPNKYIPLEQMVEMGHAKLVSQCDAKVAAMAAGLDLRPLIISEIQGHLNDFNLDAEFGTHGTIKRLSGGQKVKLVLAAAMWNKPHVIVLDEPSIIVQMSNE